MAFHFIVNAIGHVDNIPTMDFLTESSRNIQSVILTECVWDFQNDALWDTHQHALFKSVKPEVSISKQYTLLQLAMCKYHSKKKLFDYFAVRKM